MLNNRFLFIFAVALLASCSSNEPKDGAPTKNIDVSNIPDAIPRVEKVTRAGNKSSYTILGKTYRVMKSNMGYKERGIGSWYGTKFHGRNTANGEVYSMYEMTAAHKTLPIPSYVKVKNLNNGKTVIVRINDRGPFHDGRIIDLSYAAAKKIGYADKGTAPVEVTAIQPSNYQNNSVERPVITKAAKEDYHLPFNTFLQAGAFKQRQSAETLATQLKNFTHHPITIKKSNDSSGFFKVLLGPVKTNTDLQKLRQLLGQSANINALVVYH